MVMVVMELLVVLVVWGGAAGVGRMLVFFGNNRRNGVGGAGGDGGQAGTPGDGGDGAAGDGDTGLVVRGCWWG